MADNDLTPNIASSHRAAINARVKIYRRLFPEKVKAAARKQAARIASDPVLRAHVNAMRRRRRANNPGKTAAEQREWRAKNPDKVRAWKRSSTARRIRYKYGISETEYEALLAAQNGVCAACHSKDRLHLDHDHSDGSVRGILCQRCNHAIGLVRDNPATLRALASYLEAKRSAPTSLAVDASGLLYALLGTKRAPRGFEWVQP